MKNLLFTTLLVFFLSSCSKENANPSSSDEIKCGIHDNKQLYTGPKGGCYYYNSNHNKTYVDREYCKC